MKNNLYKLITFGLVLGSSLTASAQLNCGTKDANQALYAQHPELLNAFNDYNNTLTQAIQNASVSRTVDTTLYIIPIVFHIIHQNGAENISDAQIFDEVNILNRDYRFRNFGDTAAILAPFKSLASDIHIEFRLAQIDPNGNCTNGIDRIYSHLTNSASDASKLNQWPRDKYLNVWAVKTIGTAGVAGYAYYPSATAGPLYPYDGVLILSEYIGSIGTGSAFTSRALTHEIGHYLSLEHPWGDTNDPGVGCGDDLVSDTPPTKGHTACTSADLYAANCTNNPVAANYKFDSVTTTSGTTDPSVPVNPGVTMSHMIATGVGSNSSTAGKFSYDTWGTGAPDGATTFASMTGAINTGKYYEFTVSPASNAYSMTLTGISFFVDRNATGPRTWAVRSSANAYATNLAATINPANTNLSVQATNVVFMNTDVTTSQKGTKITLSGAPYTNRTTPLTFRIYAYNAENATGTFGIDSVYLAGTDGLIENTQNYMDYSYCSKMYTAGQRDRMRAALESPISNRNNLWSVSNLAATGVSSPAMCKPYPDFFSNKQRVCKGDVVKFTKNVLYGTPDSIRWEFQGGTPATSTSLSPVNVTYNTSGIYKTTLIATNSAGRDSVVKVDFIRVDEDWADIPYSGAYQETFQNTSNFYYDWQVNDYDNNGLTWAVSTIAGYQSSKCVVMNGFGNYQYDVDDLVSPSYDLSYTSGNVMTFKCAAASTAGAGLDVNDMLKVYISANCGQSWVLQATFKDSTLINNGYQSTYFVPGTNAVWTTRTVTIPATYNVANLRFKFEYTTGSASNNVYIDNINIDGTVGINEKNIIASGLVIYPNPANESSTVAYHLTSKSNTKIEVIDVLGKTVFTQVNNGQPEGEYSVVLSKQNLNLRNGIYFVKFSLDNESTTKKLVITE